MALPFSRNTTYSPDSPVKSADLNMIQDSLIVAELMRTRVRNYPIAASAFSRDDGDVTGYQLINGVQWGAGTGTLVAPLPLPVGFKLGVLTWVADRAGVASQTLSLKRHSFAGVTTTVGPTTTISAGTGIVETPITYDHVIEAGFFYTLAYFGGHINQRLHGARFTAWDATTFGAPLPVAP